MTDERLTSALEGIELDECEVRYLEWLSRMDSETVEVFAGLFEKIKKSPSPETLKAQETWENTSEEEKDAFWNDLIERIKRHSPPITFDKDTDK